MPVLTSQLEICRRYGVEPMLPNPDQRVGIAMSTIGVQPINGCRVRANSVLSGWFVFCGSEPSDEHDFYDSLCYEHIDRHLAAVVPYLCLPEGWNFQISENGYEDIWFEPRLLGD